MSEKRKCNDQAGPGVEGLEAETPRLDPVGLLLARGLDTVLERLLLLLGPRDLKACRRVCRRWDAFIREQLWGSKANRRRLERKAAAMWRKGDTPMVELGRTRSVVGGS
jgi:hypothetical protein